MRTIIFILLLLVPTLSAQFPSNHRQALLVETLRMDPDAEGTAPADDGALKGISFTITHSKHSVADYSAQSQAIADALTSAGATVKLRTYNSKTREGFYGYYGTNEAEKIDTVRKLISRIVDVKFEHSKFYDEPGANPDRMIMIYLMRNESQQN